LGVFFERGIVYSANDSRAANSVKRILGIRFGAQFSAENKDTPNILGVAAPAIQKFRVRATSDNLIFSPILAGKEYQYFLEFLICHINSISFNIYFHLKSHSLYHHEGGRGSRKEFRCFS
jgi:hypothetical protein